jgi:hypothetical protein
MPPNAGLYASCTVACCAGLGRGLRELDARGGASIASVCRHAAAATLATSAPPERTHSTTKNAVLARK